MLTMNTSHIQDQMSQRVDECVQNCMDCYRVCLAMVPHCLHRGGVHASQEHITLLMECAELCQVSARLMLLQSNIHFDVCRVCAKACEHCADNCRSMASGDAKMLNCAEVCTRCAKSCAGMAAMSHTAHSWQLSDQSQ